MKCLLLLIFGLFQINLYSFSHQANTFEIDGQIKGGMVFKYAYLFGENYSFMERKLISDHKFNFKGSYPGEFPSGAIPNGIIFLSNAEVVPEPKEILNHKSFRRIIIFEPKISIIFYSGKSYFEVKAGQNNDINNSFADAEYEVLRQADSLKHNFWLQNETEERKKEFQFINFKNANKKQDELFIGLINKYRSSPVSLLYFFNVILFLNVPRERSQETYDLLPDEIRNSKYGIRIGALFNELDEWQKIKTKHKLNVGDQFPKFELPDDSGTMVSGHTKYGKYTLVDFWANWCIPCMREMPNLKETLNKNYKNGFRVIAISMDALSDRYKWIQAIKTNQLSQFTNLINPTGTSGIAKDLEITAIPANYLIDENGKVVAINIHGEQLNKKLSELLGN